MAFVGSQANRTIVPGGGGSVFNIKVPQIKDAGGNGYGYNMFSHYLVGTLGGSSTGPYQPVIGAPGVVFAIAPSSQTIAVQQSAATDTVVVFGKMD